MSSLTLEDIDSVSEAAGGAAMRPTMQSQPPPVSMAQKLPPHMNSYQPPQPPPMTSMQSRDNVGPLPPPMWAQTFNSNPYGPSFNPIPALGQVKNYARPTPYINETASYVSMPGNGAESVHSGSGESSLRELLLPVNRP